MENENVLPEDSNLEGQTEPESVGEEVPELSDVTLEDYQKLQEVAKNQKIRAEKAERELKQLKVSPQKPLESATPKNEPKVSLKDQMAILESKVPVEDLDEVLDYAKLKSISITEALKSNIVKAILSNRAEERLSAQVANTGATKLVSSATSDDVLLEKLNKGELPEEDIERAAEARLNRMKGLKK